MTSLLSLVAAAPPVPVELEPALTGVAATVALVVCSVLVLTGVGWVLLSAVAMRRVGDALGRINVLTPATALGLTSLVVAAWLHQLTVAPFAWGDVVRVLLTLVALLVVSSVASNALARAAVLSGAPVDPATSPDALSD